MLKPVDWNIHPHAAPVGGLGDHVARLGKHGWVRPRVDGTKSRCGGPALCSYCQREFYEKYGKLHEATTAKTVFGWSNGVEANYVILAHLANVLGPVYIDPGSILAVLPGKVRYKVEESGIFWKVSRTGPGLDLAPACI